MKKFFILFLICFIQNIFSQTTKKEGDIEATFKDIGSTPETDNSIYASSGLEVKPEFPQGMIAFDKFVEKNFKIPKENLELKGKIFVTFVVEKDGSLSDIKILKDLGSDTGAETIRVLKLSPKWNPGKHNGKNVRVMFTVPITIK
ncbi:energy transducer TonB [Flavobacterium soyae]|uniref:energy transducer TonB n=1 Tax=Flavobacterium soyae TaxID=2903098 RepID=UPI001E5C4FDB|nr:energy transducer TonB [Flavobacterium soyae]MCD9574211.1 energy transducer TonB [Flavobacterium soyae]